MALKGFAAFAFSGIARPDRFEADLVATGVRLAGARRFADHHPYRADDLASIAAAARACGAEVLVTTEKDMVRIPAMPEAPPLYALALAVSFAADGDLVGFILDRLREKGVAAPALAPWARKRGDERARADRTPGLLRRGRSVFALMALLPTRAARRLGAGLGRLFFRLSPRHRRIALGNLASAFGDRLSEPERLAVAHRSFAHLGTIVADATHFPRHVRRPTEEIAVYEGVEHLEAAAALGAASSSSPDTTATGS